MSSSESSSEDGDIDHLLDRNSRHSSEEFEDAIGGLQASTASENVEWIIEKYEHRDPELPEPEPGEGDEGSEEPAPGDEAETPAERTESTSEPPEEVPGGEPTEEPSTEDPAEAPPAEPEVPLLEGPAEAPAEEPAETQEEDTAEITAEVVAEVLSEDAVEQPAEAPAEQPAEAPAEEAAEAPAEEPADTSAPADDPDEAPPEEPEEPIPEEPEEPPDEEPEEPPDEEPEEPPPEITEEPPPETAEEPPPEVPEEPPPEGAEEPPPEEPTDEPSEEAEAPVPAEPTDGSLQEGPEFAEGEEEGDETSEVEQAEQDDESMGRTESFMRSSAQALQDAVNLGRAGIGHVSAAIIENLPRAEEARTTGGLMLACLSPLSDVRPEDLARQLHEDAASAYAGLLSLLIVMLMTGRSRAMGCAVSMWLSGLAVIHVMVRAVLSDTAVGATLAYCSPPIIVASILSWATGVRGAHAAPLASLAAAWSSLAASRVFVRLSGENFKSRPLILVCGVIFCTLAALSVL